MITKAKIAKNIADKANTLEKIMNSINSEIELNSKSGYYSLEYPLRDGEHEKINDIKKILEDAGYFTSISTNSIKIYWDKIYSHVDKTT